mmetsp:Transcript_46093/g.107801  ORF Transcript_46093/g.107801 Transcript_46093/m.107801 type:complete len:83 (+) Transcript_46093:223-471(+)
MPPVQKPVYRHKRSPEKWDIVQHRSRPKHFVSMRVHQLSCEPGFYFAVDWLRIHLRKAGRWAFTNALGARTLPVAVVMAFFL